MLFKILQWVQIIVSLVLEAEGKFGSGQGQKKKAHVLEGARAEVEALSLASECSIDSILSFAGQVVEGIVGILNCFGILKRSAT